MQIYTVLAEDLNVRTFPNTENSGVVAVLHAGDEVTVDDTPPLNAEGYVWLKHPDGWIALKALYGTWVGMRPLEDSTFPSETESPFTDEQLNIILAMITENPYETIQPIVAAEVEKAFEEVGKETQAISELLKYYEYRLKTILGIIQGMLLPFQAFAEKQAVLLGIAEGILPETIEQEDVPL